MIAAVGVVVPVHDEAELLPACLSALERALLALDPGIESRAVIVLDSCADGSDAIARRWARGVRFADVLEIDVRSVGPARAAGAEAVLGHLAGVPLARTWLATTDADSRVPSSWLVEQLRIADAGIEAIAGTIRVDDWTGHPPGLDEAFARFYEPPGSGDEHHHVHGANLGVRGDAYVAAGGFAPLPTGEDHALWRALAARARVATRRLPVVTSGRRAARAPSGFSGLLSSFAQALPTGDPG